MKIYTLLILGILLVRLGQGQTLEEYLKAGIENNPELKAAKLMYDAALEKVPQVGALPDPTLSLGGFVLPVETRLGPQYARVSLSQQFPWFGTLEAKRSVAAKEAEVAYQQFLLKQNDYAFTVKEAWYKVIRVKAISNLHLKQIKLFKSLEQLALARVKSGKGKLADVLRIQMKIITQESRHKDMMSQERNWKNTLNLRTWTPSDNPVLAPDSLPVLKTPTEVSGMKSNDLTQNPVFKKLEAEKATFASRKVLISKLGKPSLGIGLDYGFVGPRSDVDIAHEGRDILMPMVSISLPIYRKKYAAMEKEQNLMLEANAQMVSYQKNELEEALVTSTRQFEDALRDQELYLGLTEKAESIYNLLLTAYSSEGSNIQDILDIQDEILEYRKKGIEARFNGLIALSLIDKITAQ